MSDQDLNETHCVQRVVLAESLQKVAQVLPVVLYERFNNRISQCFVICRVRSRKEYRDEIDARFDGCRTHVLCGSSSSCGVAVHFTVTGTQRGAFQVIEATGPRVTISEFTFYRLEDAKFAEVWDHTDMDAVTRQIGQGEAHR